MMGIIITSLSTVPRNLQLNSACLNHPLTLPTVHMCSRMAEMGDGSQPDNGKDKSSSKAEEDTESKSVRDH